MGARNRDASEGAREARQEVRIAVRRAPPRVEVPARDPCVHGALGQRAYLPDGAALHVHGARA
eukprot:424641-Prymnesium_polylepis.1